MFSLGKPGVILGSYFWLVHTSGWWRGPSSGIIRWCHPSMASRCNRNPGLEDPMPRTIQNWDLKQPRLPLPDGVALWSCSKKGEPRIWGVWATPLPTASSYWTWTTLRCDHFLDYGGPGVIPKRGKETWQASQFPRCTQKPAHCEMWETRSTSLDFSSQGRRSSFLSIIVLTRLITFPYVYVCMFASVHSMCVGGRGILRGQNRVLNLPLELGSQAVVCSSTTQVPKLTGVLSLSSKCP